MTPQESEEYIHNPEIHFYDTETPYSRTIGWSRHVSTILRQAGLTVRRDRAEVIRLGGRRMTGLDVGSAWRDHVDGAHSRAATTEDNNRLAAVGSRRTTEGERHVD
ncbi:MAG: hypothetical protein ABI255_10565 [Microbacteriaceae bacterium]